ncbi:MAG TPA: outer membrane beta-barrel protein [Terriglobales bacterium]|nr:outer membrane beta-barrel protein [Terriglobales bacterium]
MKKISLLMAFLLVFGVAFAASQPVEGKKFEFSTGLSFWSYSFHYQNEPTGYKDVETYFNIPFRLGWFFWKGLELEPEFMLTAYHESYSYTGYSYKYSETGWLLSGNLLYNFKMKNPHLLPFVLAGFGFGNGVPYGEYIEKWGSTAKATTPNFGVGLKYVFNKTAALRLEYRYRRFRIKQTEEGVSISHVTLNTVIGGLSLFF